MDVSLRSEISIVNFLDLIKFLIQDTICFCSSMVDIKDSKRLGIKTFESKMKESDQYCLFPLIESHAGQIRF